jgi:hypothetical protein
MCVTMKPRRNEEAQAHIRLSSHRKRKKERKKKKMVMCCDLMSNEDVHNESPEVANTSEVNEKSGPVPQTNDDGLVFVGSPL